MRNSTLAWLRSRAAEPSTYRGIAGLLTSIGIAVEPEQINTILMWGITVISLINIIKRDF